MAKSKFSNEVKDLARFLEAVSSEKSPQSHALIDDIESATSSVKGTTRGQVCLYDTASALSRNLIVMKAMTMPAKRGTDELVYDWQT